MTKHLKSFFCLPLNRILKYLLSQANDEKITLFFQWMTPSLEVKTVLGKTSIGKWNKMPLSFQLFTRETFKYTLRIVFIRFLVGRIKVSMFVLRFCTCNYGSYESTKRLVLFQSFTLGVDPNVFCAVSGIWFVW